MKTKYYPFLPSICYHIPIVFLFLVSVCYADVPKTNLAVPLTQDRSKGQTEQPNITRTMRIEDSRLEQPVTIHRRQTTVKDLLSELSRKTGLDLAVGEKDGSGDESITVWCDKTSLAKILNALWACMSYRGGCWEWKRTGEKTHYSYQFVQPESARQFRTRILQDEQERLEHDTEILVAAADGTEKQREDAIRKVYLDPENMARNHALTKERFWADLLSFKEALTSEERKAVLRGRRSIRVPLDRLPEISESYYRRVNREASAKMRPPGSGLLPLQEPTEVQFEAVTYYFTPALSVLVVGATNTMPIVGGVNTIQRFWPKMRGLWQLEGDASDDPAELRTMVRPADAATDPVPPIRATEPPVPQVDMYTGEVIEPEPDNRETEIQRLARRLEQISQGAHAPLVARLPKDDSPDYSVSEPWGGTLQAYWKQLWNKELMVKWREGVLVVTDIGWALQDPPLPDWLLHDLRTNARPGELLSFDDLTAAADHLTKRQLLRLEREFPVMRDVAEWRGLLTLFRRYPDLVRQAKMPDGVELTPKVISMLRELFTPEQMDILEAGDVHTMTIQVTEILVPDRESREVLANFNGADGKPRRIFGFRYKPQPRKKKIRPRSGEGKPIQSSRH